MIIQSCCLKSNCSFNFIIAAKMNIHELYPQTGSQTTKSRIARGYGGKGGGTGGRGTRGQKSRSAGHLRPGFEGGQTPLYRRIPKLKGIAGGMRAGLPSFVVINIEDLERTSGEDTEVSLETLKQKKVLKCSGRDRKLPLKVLGRGSLSKPLVLKAAAFSASARTAIEAAG